MWLFIEKVGICEWEENVCLHLSLHWEEKEKN